MNTLLLTGATGFLGSHLLKTLIAQTTDEIIIVKRSFSNIQRIKDELQNPRVHSYDIDKIQLEALPWKKIDIIIHCATEYGRKNNSCSTVLQTNLLFPIQLLELAIKNGVRAFINTDSYFNKNHLSYVYLLNYSLSKRSLNLWLKYFSKKIAIINLRLEHIYGPYDDPNKFVEYMVENIAIHPQKELDISPGEQKRDFVYVEDVCKSYLQAIQLARTKHFHLKLLEIGTGTQTSIRTFVETIKQLSHSPTKLNFGAIPYRQNEIMSSQAKNPCCIPCTTFRAGIQKILACYQKSK